MLRDKDMSAKLLDGLEMFLGVCVMFLDSSKLQMVGGWHIYRPPSRTSRLEPLPNFLHMHGISEDIALVHPVTLRHGVAVGSLTADVVSPNRPVLSHRCNQCCF